MGLRLIEMRLPRDRSEAVEESLEEIDHVEMWKVDIGEEGQMWHILAFADQAEAIVDALEDNFSLEEGFRILLTNLEAAIPRPQREEEEEAEADREEEEEPSEETEEDEQSAAPINIEELYEDVTHGMRLNRTYGAMVAMSSIVAAVGIYRDDLILVIAAMIIAPLLNPNMALSLATTMADRDLAIDAIKTNGFGLLIALGVSLLFGVMLPFDPRPDQMSLRTTIGVLDIVVAAGAGTAGALSFTAVKPGGVVGVMIAVALLPPVVSLGMLAGAGHWAMAVAPLLLTVINIICINLAAVVTFFVQNIRPRTRWEEEQAERAFWIALWVWLGLLALLGVIGYLSEDYWQSVY